MWISENLHYLSDEDFKIFDSMNDTVSTINDAWFYNRGDSDEKSWGMYKT